MGRLEAGFSLMKGSVLVAAKPLKAGEELLLDYRLNPHAASGHPLPDWYSSYDNAEAARRWGHGKESEEESNGDAETNIRR
jgi:hypothetical protein